ncbi:hypothetical protein [Sutcliffiella deserti]|uniref:hypothetical protein n=1 Tax=Sutcliffiella deserti TaxID=2875501 RepID=UPI001CBE8ACE|nr:hypothetical protein [Sutcliffiella deserti]
MVIKSLMVLPLAVMFMAGCSMDDTSNETQGNQNQETNEVVNDQAAKQNDVDEVENNETDSSVVGDKDSKKKEEVPPIENNHSKEEEENEDNQRTLTKEEAQTVLEDYKNTFQVEKTAEGIVENYDSKEELLAHYKTRMAEELAESYLDYFYRVENGNLRIIATEPPVWLDPDQEFELRILEDSTYQIVQSRESQLRGNREYSFVITYNAEVDNWVVSEVKSREVG